MKYKDLFIDFDDTLYDTHGNAVIALRELFDALHMERWFLDPNVFYNRYWENFDICLSSRDKDLVYALAHCSWARVTYIGDRGFNHVKILSKEQIKDFYNTLQLYRVMGGKL